MGTYYVLCGGDGGAEKEEVLVSKWIDGEGERERMLEDENMKEGERRRGRVELERGERVAE